MGAYWGVLSLARGAWEPLATFRPTLCSNLCSNHNSHVHLPSHGWMAGSKGSFEFDKDMKRKVQPQTKMPSIKFSISQEHLAKIHLGKTHFGKIHFGNWTFGIGQLHTLSISLKQSDTLVKLTSGHILSVLWYGVETGLMVSQRAPTPERLCYVFIGNFMFLLLILCFYWPFYVLLVILNFHW